MKDVPTSIYRLQLSEQVNFAKIVELLPYLESLGIDGLYCSPIFEAETEHGYDIVNPNRLNPKLGTLQEWDTLCRELQKRGMKLILDVVPNHMSIKGKHNHWWLDVLENGPQSQYADFFDIDWNPEQPELKNKILLPILGDPYGQTLLNQEIKLLWDNETFWIGYLNYRLPIAPHTYHFILNIFSLEDVQESEEWLTCLTLVEELKEGGANRALHKQNLSQWYKKSDSITNYFSQILKQFNGKEGDHHSFDLLHALLEQQYYRLAYWQVAGQEINYRRFFNINDLIAIHIEKEKVLQAHHHWLFQLIEENKVQGVRIDHPDGLYNPTQYFDRLQTYKPSFVVIEKILDSEESLPHSFHVQGMVGYDFLNVLNGLFIDKKKEAIFDKIYSRFIGHKLDFDRILYERKKEYMMLHMESELHTLGWRLSRLTESNRYYRDFTRIDLTRALGEIIACFPVYRTYIYPGTAITKKDRDYIVRSVESAKLKTPHINPLVYDYIRDLLLTELKYPLDQAIDFTLRFQQQTAPVMAKGLEDSTFYIFNRLISLNEVGGNPKKFGVSKPEFHQFNSEKLTHWPLSFLTTSTHDTKRSEDMRMRLNVLSELPKEWDHLIKLWAKENRKFKKNNYPDSNTEYYLYQTLLGIWPTSAQEAESPPFWDRLWICMLKAVREAGNYTSWLHPNESYEKALQDFLHAILQPHPENRFYPSFIDFQKNISYFGELNSLSALILKLGSCGIFELYQGCEALCYTQMDPDNRRPVDFPALMNKLQLQDDTTLKNWITQQGLKLRLHYPELFLKGEYISLRAQKKYKDHVIAFLRRDSHFFVLFAASRFFTQLPSPPIGSNWEDTNLIIPKEIETREFFDILTSQTLLIKKKQGRSHLFLAELFQSHPFAILISKN